MGDILPQARDCIERMGERYAMRRQGDMFCLAAVDKKFDCPYINRDFLYNVRQRGHEDYLVPYCAVKKPYSRKQDEFIVEGIKLLLADELGW